MSGRRPAELDDVDHRHVADATRVDRIMGAIDSLSDAREKLEQRDQQILDRLRMRDQADGIPGDVDDREKE